MYFKCKYKKDRVNQIEINSSMINFKAYINPSIMKILLSFHFEKTEHNKWIILFFYLV